MRNHFAGIVAKKVTESKATDDPMHGCRSFLCYEPSAIPCTHIHGEQIDNKKARIHCIQKVKISSETLFHAPFIRATFFKQDML